MCEQHSLMYFVTITNCHLSQTLTKITTQNFLFTLVPGNPCDPNPCFRGVQCLPDPRDPNGFRCGPCPRGFKGDGRNCQRHIGCDQQPCFQGNTYTSTAENILTLKQFLSFYVLLFFIRFQVPQ